MSAPDSPSIDGEPFASLADELLVESAVTRTDRPGRASLRVNGRVFATDHEGYLILPRERR